MSNCETVGWGKCACCGGAVAVKKNRGGRAYYRCDHCGVQVQHHWARSSDKLLAAVGAVEEKPAEKPAEVAPPPAGEKPQKAASKKAAPGTVAAMFGL